MKKVSIFVCVVLPLALLAGCSKNSTSSPAPSNSTSSLSGKWEATGAYVYNYDSTGKFINLSGISRTFQNAGIIPWEDSFTTYVTFNSDNTYNMTHKDGSAGGYILIGVMPTKGEWRLKNNDSVLNLTTYSPAYYTDFRVVDFTTNHLKIVDSGVSQDHSIQATYFEFAK